MPTEPTETAWKIQSAVADATAKADSKAALALTLQSTMLAVLSLLASSRRAAGGFESGRACCESRSWSWNDHALWRVEI